VDSSRFRDLKQSHEQADEKGPPALLRLFVESEVRLRA
jgi:hypothetical protein